MPSSIFACLRAKLALRMFLGIALLSALTGRADEPAHGGFGAAGGPSFWPVEDCLSPAQANWIDLQTLPSLSASLQAAAASQSELYTFIPIAGTAWRDRFILNFVDLDPAPDRILDWDCTGFAYDGHNGHDINLRSFAEQDIGVPVFAALDGTVVSVHDGEEDRNTEALGQPANVVVLRHSAVHTTVYFHLRKNSIGVAAGQSVRAGEQIGLAASSGSSTAPHLHFESRINGKAYEPFAGPCRAGAPGWAAQVAIPRAMGVLNFAAHANTSIPAGSFFPHDPPRLGTFVRTGAFQPIGLWYTVQNQPAGSTWRARYLRPNGSQFFDSGSKPYGASHPFYRQASWWIYYNLNLDTPGLWHIEFSMNGAVLFTAPFTVLNAGGVPANRPPAAITAAFDPPQPGLADVIFARVEPPAPPAVSDLDYDLVRYRYVWKTNGVAMRSVTNAALSDAIPRGLLSRGDALTCEITPLDGLASGPSTMLQASFGPPPALSLQVVRVSPSQIALAWPSTAAGFRLEAAPSLVPPAAWVPVTDSPAENDGQKILTNAINTRTRYFRLSPQ